MAETCLKRRWALASLARSAWFHFLCGKPRHLGWNGISCLTDNIRFAPCQAGTLHAAPQASLSLCLWYQSHQCRSVLSSSLLILMGPPPISLFPFLSKPHRHRHTCTTTRHSLTFHVPFRYDLISGPLTHPLKMHAQGTSAYLTSSSISRSWLMKHSLYSDQETLFPKNT